MSFPGVETRESRLEVPVIPVPCHPRAADPGIHFQFLVERTKTTLDAFVRPGLGRFPEVLVLEARRDPGIQDSQSSDRGVTLHPQPPHFIVWVKTIVELQSRYVSAIKASF